MSAEETTQPQPGPAPARPARPPSTTRRIDDARPGDASSSTDVFESAFKRGEVINGYRIVRFVAQGGMGVVYEAVHTVLQRRVALKFLSGRQSLDAVARARLQFEAESAAQLEHPNIVPVYEFGECRGRSFYAMKWIDGLGLDDWARRERARMAAEPLRAVDLHRAFLREVAGKLAKVARALHHAHQRGFIHRDVKPSNIRVDADGEPWVTDFGLARRLIDPENLTLTGEVVGTPAYMSPEQAQGGTRALTLATDIFSLGSVIYHLLAERSPFESASIFETMRMIEDAEPERLSRMDSRIHSDLDTICLKCLRKRPADRYASAEAVAEDLERWLEGKPIRARPATRWERVSAFAQRKPLVTSLGLITVFLAAAFIVFLMVSRSTLESLVRETQATAASEHTQRGLAEERQREAELERTAAESARLDLNRHLNRLRFQAADETLRAGKVPAGLAEMARLVRDDPDLPEARQRLVGVLATRPLVRAEPFCLLHKDPVTRLAMSPDGRWVMTGSDDGSVRLFETKTGAPVGAPFSVGPAPVEVLQVDPVAGWLIAASREGVVCLRKLDGTELFRRDFEARLVSVQVSPDRQYAAIGVEGLPFLSLPGGETVYTSRPMPVTQIRWNSESTMLACAGRWGGFFLHDLAARERRETSLEYRRTPRQIEFSPTTNWFITIGHRKEAVIWDTGSFETFHSLSHRDEISAVAISGDGTTIATGDTTGGIHLWDASDFSVKAVTFNLRTAIQRLQFSASGTRLLAVVGTESEGCVKVLDVVEGEVETEGIQWNQQVVADASLDWIATRGDKCGVEIWNTRELMANPPTRVSKLFPLPHEVVVSPQGDTCAATSETGYTAVIDTEDLEDLGVLGNKFLYPPEIDVHPAGDRWLFQGGPNFYSVSYDGKRVRRMGPVLDFGLFGAEEDDRIFISKSGSVMLKGGEESELGRLEFEEGEIRDVIRNRPKGRLCLLTAKRIVECSLKDLKTTRECELPPGWPELAQKGVSAGGNWLWGVGANEKLYLVNLAGDKPSFWEENGTLAVIRATCSPDNRLFVTTPNGEGLVFEFQRDSLAPVSRLLHGSILDGAFSLEGRLLVTISRDKYVEFWDPNSGTPVWEPIELRWQPTCLGVDERASFVVVGDADYLNLWKLNWRDAVVGRMPWLPDLAEAVARRTVADDGSLRPLARSEVRARLDRVRAATGVAALPDWARQWVE